MHFALFLLFPVKVLGLLIGGYHYKKLLLPYKLLFFQVALALVAEVAGAYLGLVLNQHNIWLFNLYMVVEMLLVCTPAILLINNQKLRKAYLILMAIGIPAWAANIYLTGLEAPVNAFFLFYCIIVLVIYLGLLFDSGLFNNKQLSKQPLFWMALSAMLFFGCMIPYKGIETYLFANDMRMARALFNINFALNFLRYLFLAITFYLAGSAVAKNKS